MILENIYVESVLTNKLCFIFSDGGTWRITTDIFSAERVAILQYIPSTPTLPILVSAETFVVGENIKQIVPLGVTYEYDPDKIDFVNISVSKDDGATWVKVVEAEAVSGISSFDFSTNTFTVGDNILVKIEKYDDESKYGISNSCSLT